jgi:hypothetical protein
MRGSSGHGKEPRAADTLRRAGNKAHALFNQSDIT